MRFPAFVHSTIKHAQAQLGPQQRTNPTGIRATLVFTAQHVLDSFAGPGLVQSSPYNAELSHVQQHFASHLRILLLWVSSLFQRKLFPSTYKVVAVYQDIIYLQVCC